MRPGFWLLSAVITLGAGLFLGPAARQQEPGVFGLSLQGVVAGLGMMLRALFLVMVSVYLGEVLARPSARKWLQRIGPDAFFDALAAASAAVPALIERLAVDWSRPSQGEKPASRWVALKGLFSRQFARSLLHEAHQIALARVAQRVVPPVVPTVLVAWGAPGSGKTTWMQAVADLLASQGATVGGVLQPKTPALSSPQSVAGHGYALREPRLPKMVPLAGPRRRQRPGQMRFEFRRQAFDWAAARIERTARSGETLFLDEFGHLESQGLGHFPALVRASYQNRSQVWVICTRETRRQEATSLLSFGRCVQLPIAETPPELAAARIRELS